MQLNQNIHIDMKETRKHESKADNRLFVRGKDLNNFMVGLSFCSTIIPFTNVFLRVTLFTHKLHAKKGWKHGAFSLLFADVKFPHEKSLRLFENQNKMKIGKML